MIAQNELKSVDRNANEHSVFCKKASSKILLIPEGEDIVVVVKQITVKNLVEDNIKNVSDLELFENEKIKELKNEVFRAEERLKCLVVAKATQERHVALDQACDQAFTQYQRNLRLQKQESM